jgi:hypothetical protein
VERGNGWEGMDGRGMKKSGKKQTTAGKENFSGVT